MNKKFMVVALMAALSTVGYAEVSLELFVLKRILIKIFLI